MPTPTPENDNATASRTDKAVVCDASGSAIQGFRNDVMGQFMDYFPKPGEICEYQRSLGLWIPCEIISEERRQPTLYLARYEAHTGQIKTGLVGPCNLRPSSQDTVVRDGPLGGRSL